MYVKSSLPVTWRLSNCVMGPPAGAIQPLQGADNEGTI